ncbi:hypothetical protein H9Q13_01820 [Pontibacter sp. JH31]|uniref:Uncharacterized protein n=1 Tax=Pontibacter aquaedesilientis TaxID=2766980 RepID=A0ABR7XC59_9BACT|nr:hypothetical protein [Pontibacter aquaedesilientis]MBD1395888.1 hypothetical protein [Pontibacter aquaedesilientis]
MKELTKLSKIVSSVTGYAYASAKDLKLYCKEELFLKNLEEGAYKNDADAAADLYNSGPDDVRYKMLKHRVKNRLYGNLNFVDPDKSGLNDVRKKELECNNLLYQANVLRLQYEFGLVTSVANKALVIARELDFTDLEVNALELLNLSYSELGSSKKFLTVQKELRHALERFIKEREAVSIFQHVTVQLRKSIKTRKEFLPELPEIIRQLEDLWLSSGTFSAFDAYYKTFIWYHELEGNFKEIISITVNSLKLVDNNKVNSHRFDLMYNNYILVYAHLRAKDFSNGLQYAEKNLSLYNTSSLNWFAYMENYFLLAVHAKQYELGNILLQQVFDNFSFSSVPTTARERWMLYLSYFRLIYPQATLTGNEAKNPYLLSLPEYSKDKLGFNVAILTLQYIYLLEKGDSEALLYRIESLKKYISTHLKDVFSLRSKLFLKLLILAFTEGYDAEQSRRKGENLYRRLIATPAPGDAYAEIEIVPYEHLWDLILQILTRKENGIDTRLK